MTENKHPNEQETNQQNDNGDGKNFADDVLKNINVDDQNDTDEHKEGNDLLSRMGFKSGNKESKHKKETEELKQQLGEEKDKYLRLYAEFDNFKKRTAKERI